MNVFILHTIKKNILKHWQKSFLSILISVMIVLFLLLYMKNMEENTSQLFKLGETIPVTVRVCNGDGSQDIGLQINFTKLQKIVETGLVTDEVILTQAYADLSPKAYEEEAQPPEFNLVGANALSSFTAFSPQDVSYIQNYDKSFLIGDEAVCMISSNILFEKKLKLGDELELSVFAPEYDAYGGYSFTYKSLGVVKLKVIGSYDITNAGSMDLPDIISPIGFIAGIYENVGLPQYASTARFTLKEPLKINEFKSKMQELGFRSIDMQAEFSRKGDALTMKDETFIRSATQLKQSLRLLQSLAPMIFIIIAVIGFISSYLLMQSRQHEFAIMRSLGTGRKRSFLIIFLENLILVLTGSLLGAVVAAFGVGVELLTMGLILVAFLIFYLLGTTIALLLLNRFSVMAILSKTD